MIFIDTETTGLMQPEASNIILQPHLIEVYACRVDKKFKVVDEFSTLIKPAIPIPDFITKITGISDSKVKTSPSFIKIFDDLYKFFWKSKSIVGHNVSFDMDVIRMELTRLDLQYNFCWPKQRYCTVELSQSINNHRMKLGALYELATGKEMKKSHRAKVDVLALIECFKWLKKKGYVK